MDQESFDRIARALGGAASRRAGVRAALGGLLGLGVGSAALDADAKGKDRGKGRDRAGAARRRHECGPDQPCPTGFDCVTQGRKRRCVCSTGVVCDAACCPAGQVCRDGACTVPTTCIAPGEPCKGLGKPCCDGRTCSSGQGGQNDIACYVHKTGACQSTADCVYGTACIDGRCGFDVPPPAATGSPCNPDVGQQCADPAATCTQYTGPGAPGGSYCTLPLDVTCSGDPDCTCYRCWYPNGTLAPAARAQQAPDPEPRLACCGPEGFACSSDKNCCLGTTCVNGTCQAVCDVCASGCPYTTIGAAFAAMPSGSTIRIAPGEYVGNENRVEINASNLKSVSFVRCGSEGTVAWNRPASEPAVKINSFFNPAPDIDLALVGIDFVGQPTGNSEKTLVLQGRNQVLNQGVNQTLVLGCRFSGEGRLNINNAPEGGQAIDVTTGNRLTVIDSVFENNFSGSKGTAINVFGGTANDRVTVMRCIFRNNATHASSNDGGGAISKAGDGTMRIVDSLCENNQASNGVGGCINVGKGALTLENVQMRGNQAKDGGGAVYVHVAPASLEFKGATSASGNLTPANRFGSGVLCRGDNCGTRISGTTTANIAGNTPEDRNCAISTTAVSCDTWT